ncbi:hypothetical protein D3C72_1594820 [compost metagenome]
MICSVSKVSGTCGRANIGSVEGNSPRSPTVRISMPEKTATQVRTTMATSGDGMIFVTRGKR